MLLFNKINQICKKNAITITMVTLFIGIVFMHPRIAANSLAFASSDLVEDLVSGIEVNQSFDPQKFWYVKDIINTNGITFYKDGVEHQAISTIIDNTLIDTIVKQDDIIITTTSSTVVKSIDILTKETSIQTEIDALSANIPSDQIIYSAKNHIIYRDVGKIYIIFLEDIETMEQTHGFYKLLDSKNERYLLEGRNWKNITVFLPNVN